MEILVRSNYKDGAFSPKVLGYIKAFVLLEVSKSSKELEWFSRWRLSDNEEDLITQCIASIKKVEDRKLKTEGKLYPSTKHIVSFTKDDAMGMLQVKAAFELGLPETIIEFSNGTKMPIKAKDFPGLAKWFAVERNSFFI